VNRSERRLSLSTKVEIPMVQIFEQTFTPLLLIKLDLNLYESGGKSL
jgi:hypothetical protein